MANIIHLVVGRPKENASNGILRSVDLLIRAQRSCGHDVFSLFFSRGKGPTDVDSQRFSMGILGVLGAYLKLLSLKVDRIYFHGGCHWRLDFILLLLAFGHCKPAKVIFVPRGAFSLGSFNRRNFLARLYSRTVERLLIRYVVNFVQALSEAEKDQMIETIAICRSKVVVIPNAVDLGHRSYRCPVEDFPLKIIYCGRIDWLGKGIDLLVAALKVVNRYSLDCQLTIVGPRGSPISEEFLDKALSEHSGFIRRVDEAFGESKFDLYDQSHVFVLVSRSEGLPTGLIEAAAYGIPCVATKETNLSTDDFERGVIMVESSVDDIVRVLKSIQVAKLKSTLKGQLNFFALKYHPVGIVEQHDQYFS